MPTWREIGLVYGGAHIGKGVSKAIDMIDPALGATNKKVWERPSFWTTLAISVGVPVLAAFAEKRVRSRTAKALLAAGAVAAAAVSTKIWDYVEEAMATAGAGAAAARAVATRATPAPITYSVSAPVAVTAKAPSQSEVTPTEVTPALPGAGF
jgi:hypothetical protein